MTPVTNAAATSTTALADAGFLTTFNLAVIAVFAVIVVICIIYGMRARARRLAALREADANALEAGVAPPVEQAAPDSLVAAPRIPADVSGVAAGAVPEAAQPVTILKGLGPKVAALLADRGVTTVGQLAALTDTQAAALDTDLGAFAGRLGRDRWVEQARLLASGDRAGFEAAFGKL